MATAKCIDSRLKRTRDNLLRIATKLPPYELDGRSAYHHMFSLILSQRVRFKAGQRTRSMLYRALGEAKLDNLFDKIDECPDYVEEDKWGRMRAVHDAWPDVDEVKGVGPWTRSCAHHMAGDHARGGFVEGDRAVQRLVSLMFCDGSKVSKLLHQEEGGVLFSKLWQLTRCSDKDRVERVRALLRDSH